MPSDRERAANYRDRQKGQGKVIFTVACRADWVSQLDAFTKAEGLRGRAAALDRIFTRNPDLLRVEDDTQR